MTRTELYDEYGVTCSECFAIVKHHVEADGVVYCEDHAPDDVSTRTIRVQYVRSYLVRRVQTYVVDLALDDLTEEQVEAVRRGDYDPDLDQIICDAAGPEEEDYEGVDEWDIDATLTVLSTD